MKGYSPRSSSSWLDSGGHGGTGERCTSADTTEGKIPEGTLQDPTDPDQVQTETCHRVQSLPYLKVVLTDYRWLID